MKNITRLLAITGIAFALAGCQTAFNPPGDYKFEQSGEPTRTDQDTSVSVRFVHANESAVAGATLYTVRWVPTSKKNAPITQKLTPLQPDGRGGFLYTAGSIHTGDTLRLAARIGPDGSLFYGSVEAH
jgi:hypothetical protein